MPADASARRPTCPDREMFCRGRGCCLEGGRRLSQAEGGLSHREASCRRVSESRGACRGRECRVRTGRCLVTGSEAELHAGDSSGSRPHGASVTPDVLDHRERELLTASMSGHQWRHDDRTASHRIARVLSEPFHNTTLDLSAAKTRTDTAGMATAFDALDA